jgi:leucine efflux protein
MFESFGVINYYEFIVAATAIVLMPGPNSLYVLSISAKQGIHFGYCGAFGIFLGDMIIMLITGLGAYSVIKAYPWIFQSIKYVGVMYLAYLGLNILYQSCTTIYHKHIQHLNNTAYMQNKKYYIQNNIPPALASYKNVVIKALYISLMNPKAIVFFLAFFMQFIQPNIALWKPFLVLGTTLQIISLLYLTLVILAGKHLAHFFTKYTWLKYSANIATGILFIYFAYLLFLGTHN